jgi:hypothetical protein
MRMELGPVTEVPSLLPSGYCDAFSTRRMMSGHFEAPMAQIIPFIPMPASYPTRTTLLDAAERAFLMAIRRWVRLQTRRGFRAAFVPAAFSIDALMAIVARTVRQPIAIHCPRCPHPSADQTHLMRAACLVQADKSAQAEHALRTVLLSASSTVFALGALEGLGGLFARASLRFTRRRSPAGALSPDGAIETWTPSMPAPTAH